VIVGSLFSGIGGLDYGLARAGFRHAFLCESDPWRREVLAHHFPGVSIYEDVADVGRGPSEQRDRRRDDDDIAVGRDGEQTGQGHQRDPALDLICGGFPCQDVSVAGRRAGLAGARSGLFHEFARIAESLRPRWLLVENVPGLLSSNGGRDFGVVLGTLADIGYGVAWRVVDSRYFGVPQRRRRVFVVGALADGDPRGAAERAGQVLAVGTRCERHPATRGEAGQDSSVASLSGLGSGGPDDNDGQGGRLVAPALIRRYGKGTDSDATDAMVAAPLSHGSNPNSNMAGRRREDDENLVSLATVGVRQLTPRECERLQALPDDWTAFGPDSRRYAALGDAVTASVAEWIGRRLLAA
jgi:DNA (cytosine-5)-methyltransferase 1